MWSIDHAYIDGAFVPVQAFCTSLAGEACNGRFGVVRKAAVGPYETLPLLQSSHSNRRLGTSRMRDFWHGGSNAGWSAQTNRERSNLDQRQSQTRAAQPKPSSARSGQRR